MTDTEEAATQNTAEFGASVGIQAEQVHNSTVYMVMPDAPPRRKFDVGVRFLEDGVPARARELMNEAIAQGLDNGEVRFHWVLAMLSKRAYRDLNTEERNQLGRIPDFLGRYVDDEWKHALEAIHELLECQYGSGGDLGLAFKAIQELHRLQRELIVRHLDLMLTGGAKDNLWNEKRDAARAARLNGDRVNRVWAYFQPDPIEALARTPVAISTTASNWVGALTCTVPFILSAYDLGRAVLASASPVPIVGIYLIAVIAGYFGFRDALEWHYRSLRRHAKESAHFGRLRVSAARDGAFARQVENSINYYFAKYVPEKQDRERWLAATERIRAAMRDEIVDLYGESGISVTRVRWLIRYLASDVKKRWTKGTLREYRTQWRTRPVVRLRCLLSFAAFGLAVAGVVVEAAGVDPVRGVGAAFVLLASGIFATRQWSRISHEKRRFADDYRDYEQTLADRQAAYQRWHDKLESTRPQESEMETWLNCDRTILLDEALSHYKLAWQDVIAYAFLQTPAGSYKRARTEGCPWRYSKYDMRLFLVTQDGMREYRAEFDFEKVVSTRNERNNFRFDAVSSVGVVTTGELNYTLTLTLNNGPAKDIRVTEAETRQPEMNDEAERLSRLNLDTAGFMPTLHILEGIAAEGKGWLQRERQFGGPSTAIDDF